MTHPEKYISDIQKAFYFWREPPSARGPESHRPQNAHMTAGGRGSVCVSDNEKDSGGEK